MTTPRPELSDCEELLASDDELQLRQVHPNHVDGDVVARDAFVGTSDATDEVSTVRSAKRSAQQAYDYHRDTLGLQSAGTWAVSVREIADADCRTIDDSGCDGIDTPGHSYVDMRNMSKAERRLARTVLAVAATSRGRLHPSSD